MTRLDEDGLSIIFTALLAVALLIVVAIVVDLGNVRQVRTQLTSAADAGALAGAQDLPTRATAVGNAALYAGATSTSTSPVSVACPSGASADTFCYRAGDADIEVVSPYKGDVNKIHVRVCRKVLFGFGHVIGAESLNPCRGAAAILTRGTAAGASVLVLNPSGSKAFTCSGSCNVNVGAGTVVVNSSASDALDVSGGASLTAGTMHVVGDARTSGGGTIACSLTPACPSDHASASDPLAGLLEPFTAGLPHFSGAYTPTFSPGVYDGTLTVSSATATFQPGTYYLTSGLNISGGSHISGTGVFFYNAGGKFTLSGGSVGSLTPPTSGPYAGMLLFQARSNTETATLSGGSGLSLPGTFYVPNVDANTTLSGGSSTSDAVGIGRIITGTLTVSGSSAIGPGFGGGGNATGPPRVALIE